MLRLSKKTDYALIALKDLASSERGTSCSAREIAARYDIPIELMAKVLQRLARRGLLESHQGTRGGYQLSRPANRISVADVIQAIDGPVLVTACSDEDETCDQYSKCNVRDPLWRLKDRIVESLTSFTLKELAEDDPLPTFPLTVVSGHAKPGPVALRSVE
jgi:Rrf2 family protein